jgi:Ca2+-binding EF-hand superfamily protein
VDSNISENKFLEYITKLIIFESKIENAKIDLIKRPDFNIEDAFYIFCNSQSKVISISDFKNGLKEFDLYPTSKEIKLIMRRADKDNKNYLNFDDFFDLLTPFQKEYREKVEKEIKSCYKPNNNKSDVFLFCTKIYLSNLIRLIIECESELNFIKENIIGINIYLENIFNKIDKSGLGFISEIELFLYLQNSGIKCNEIENGLIFKRFDKNKNEKIEIWEIEDELKSL